jgi:hypothetical protein
LTILASGEAIVFGSAFQIPARVQFDRPYRGRGAERQRHSSGVDDELERINAPKRIVREDSGRAIGMEPVSPA